MKFIQHQIGDIRRGGISELWRKMRILPKRFNATMEKNMRNIINRFYTVMFGPWIRWRDKQIQREVERKLHNENLLWYTLSPMLLTAIVKALNIQSSNHPQKEAGLPEERGYYEFGIFKGFSFWFAEWISRECKSQNLRFYGFDSFEGLPEPQSDETWEGGNYASSLDFVTDMLKQNGTDLSRVKLYKGFFSKQLFESLRQSEDFCPCSICVIDCDLYDSTVEVLDFMKHYFVPGSILLIDEYLRTDETHGEKRALLEFEQKNPSFSKEHLFDFGEHGSTFRVKTI
jgi:O-methyltransferase